MRRYLVLGSGAMKPTRPLAVRALLGLARQPMRQEVDDTLADRAKRPSEGKG